MPHTRFQVAQPSASRENFTRVSWRHITYHGLAFQGSIFKCKADTEFFGSTIDMYVVASLVGQVFFCFVCHFCPWPALAQTSGKRLMELSQTTEDLVRARYTRQIPMKEKTSNVTTSHQGILGVRCPCAAYHHEKHYNTTSCIVAP